MATPRLRTEIWVGAYVRRQNAEGAFATVARKGDPDAGAIAVKVFAGRGEDGAPQARLFIQSRDLDGESGFRDPLGGLKPEADIDAYVEKAVRIDPDLWLIEVERADGEPGLVEPVFS